MGFVRVFVCDVEQSFIYCMTYIDKDSRHVQVLLPTNGWMNDDSRCANNATPPHQFNKPTSLMYSSLVWYVVQSTLLFERNEFQCTIEYLW